MMPSEEEHLQRQQLEFDSPSTPASQTHRRTGSKDSSFTPESPLRPRMSSRHTFDGDFPTTSTTSPVVSSHSHPGHNPTSSRSATSGVPRRPPACPRTQPSRQPDDWYTLIGCPEFDICSSCYEKNFGSGSFHKYFKLAEAKDPRQKVKCDFGSPWMRLAWLLTQQQRRYDLDLIYAVARISSDESRCPGEYGEARNWFTVPDKRGAALEGFDVCSADAKKIEALMPSLRGMFIRRPHGTGQRRKCEFRVETKRFPEYLDLLVDIDENAHIKRKQPDFQRFQDFARQKAQTRECMKDDMLEGVGWHFIPQLPEFTVCEECYSCVVWPSIVEGSSVASRFNRTPQLVCEAKRGDRRRDSSSNTAGLAASCQLYSTRMRKIYRTAVQTGDLGYLARKARERKDKEEELQARFAKLKQIDHDIEKNGLRGSHKSPGLQAEFEKISADWQRWE